MVGRKGRGTEEEDRGERGKIVENIEK